MSVAAESVEQVAVEGNEFVINHLRVISEVVASAARERPAGTSLPAWTHQALELGARATALAAPSNGMVALQAQVKLLTGEVAHVTTALGERLADVTDPNEGSITTAVRRELASLSQQVHSLVAGEDAPVRAAMARTLADAEHRLVNEAQKLATQHATALKAVVDVGDASSPLGALRSTVERIDASLNDLRTHLAVSEATDAERVRGTAKGADFEADIAALLSDLAHKAGDLCEPVGNAEGALPGCKKGDLVITLAEASAPNIVVEVKDRKQGVGAWRRYLAEASENRSATVAIGIVRSADQVPCGALVQVVQDNTFLVAVDPADDVSLSLLVAVYRLARARAVALANGHANSDHAEVEAAIRSAQEHLEGAADIVRRSRRASTEADAVAIKVASLVEHLEADLDRAVRALSTVEEEDVF